MPEAKVTLKSIIDVVRSRPTTPELELAVCEFLDLNDSEQKVLIFRELVNLSSQINWIIEKLK